MTSTLRRLPAFAMAAAITLSATASATAASPQSAGKPPAHDHQDQGAAPSPGGAAGMKGMHDGAMAGMPHDVMARIAVLDTRIQSLATDMHMFAGEMKIETMAALLDALVERQSVMTEQMRRMHEGMMGRMTGEMRQMREGMMGRMTDREGPAAPPDEEPGAMCSPSS